MLTTIHLNVGVNHGNEPIDIGRIAAGLDPIPAQSKVWVDVNGLDEHGEGGPVEELASAHDTIYRCYVGDHLDLTFRGDQTEDIPDRRSWGLGPQGVRVLARSKGQHVVLRYRGQPGVGRAAIEVEQPGPNGPVTGRFEFPRAD